MTYTVYRKRGLLVVQWVTALGFVGAAVQKFVAAPSVMGTFHAMGWGAPPRIALGVVEVVGAVALLVPILAGVAACGFVALTTCATVAQVSTGESVMPPLVMLALSALIGWARRDSIADLRRRLAMRLNVGVS